MTDITLTFTRQEWNCIVRALAIANALQYEDATRQSLIDRIVKEFEDGDKSEC